MTDLSFPLSEGLLRLLSLHREDPEGTSTPSPITLSDLHSDDAAPEHRSAVVHQHVDREPSGQIDRLVKDVALSSIVRSPSVPTSADVQRSPERVCKTSGSHGLVVIDPLAKLDRPRLEIDDEDGRVLPPEDTQLYLQEVAQPADREVTRKRLKNEVRILKEKRLLVLGTRMRVQEFRSSMRHERTTTRTMARPLLQRLARATGDGSVVDMTNLASDIEKVHRSFAQLDKLEDLYNLEEDRLNQEEHEMGEMESRALQQSTRSQPSSLGVGESAFSYCDDEELRSTASISHGQVPQSLYVDKMQSMRGDIDLLEERIDAERYERTVQSNEIFWQEDIGERPDEASQEWLLGSDAREAGMQQKLAELKEEFETMKYASSSSEQSQESERELGE